MELEHNNRIIKLRDQIKAETDKEKLGELVNELIRTIYEFESSRRSGKRPRRQSMAPFSGQPNERP